MASQTPDNRGDGSPIQREIAELVDAMKMLLKANIDSVTTSQYGAAKAFLLSLEYEVRFPNSSMNVAATAKPSTNTLTTK